MKAPNTGRQRGASLLEATLATLIAGVLTTAAVPSMNDAMTQQRPRSGSSDLFATFNLATTEAIRRGNSVAVIPADARDCSTGWKVFADRNDNGVQDTGEETILERQPTANGVSIRPNFGATYSGQVLTYTSAARLHRPGGQGLVHRSTGPVAQRLGAGALFLLARRTDSRRANPRLNEAPVNAARAA